MNDLFAPFYEGWGLFYLNNFSDDLFNNKLYMPVGLTLLISGLVFMVVYYYVINHPRFNRWFHWIFYVLFLCLLNFIYAYFTTKNELSLIYENNGTPLPYSFEFYTFSLVNAFWVFLWAIILSFIIRWGSKNCSTTPIPN